MAENDGQWERRLIEKLVSAALEEQRRARRWSIFFRLLTFGVVLAVVALAVDWKAASEPTGGPHTAVVDLEGLIAPGGDASADRIIAALDAAFKDRGTRGVVLRINSPGGSPVQAQDIYDEMRRLRRKYPKIPLYVVAQDICASGGYYVAVAADKIYVSPNSLIGSIGVRMDSFGFTGLMQKLGIQRRLLTAGANKGFLDPFLPEDPKQKLYALTMLEEIHKQFIHVVRQGRGKRLTDTPDMFSGLVWTGSEGIKLGLADGFGDLRYVARDVIGAKRIVDFTQKESLAEKLARRFGAGVASALAGFAVRQEAPGLR